MITVVGCDGGPLAPAAREALGAASCVVGTARHLDALPVPAEAHRITLGALEPAMDEVASRSGPIVVLASGDPGFFGVLRTLRARGLTPRVVPAVSSVALAFARLGLPWDDALVVSAHGRDPRPALAAAVAHPKTAILTGPGDAGPERFADELLAAGRQVYVAERLGAPEERVVRVTDETEETAGAPDGFTRPNVVLAFDGDRAVSRGPGWLAGHQGAPDGWGLPEEHFAHRDSMITKPEVRALALARLAPRPGTVVWDVGAGSGSVAVECARFGARVLAFEKDPDQCGRVRENAAALGAYVTVIEGEAPESFGGMGPPEAVFLGGGGTRALAGAIPAGAPPARPRRVVAALAAVDKVRPVRDLLAAHGYVTGGTAVQASRLADLPGDSIRLTAANPVFVLWGELA